MQFNSIISAISKFLKSVSVEKTCIQEIHEAILRLRYVSDYS